MSSLFGWFDLILRVTLGVTLSIGIIMMNVTMLVILSVVMMDVIKVDVIRVGFMMMMMMVLRTIIAMFLFVYVITPIGLAYSRI